MKLYAHNLYHLLSLCLCLFYIGQCTTSQTKLSAQEKEGMCEGGEITVWGEAPIFTSVSAAQATAKQDACRRAVEKCIGEQVASATGVSDGQSILNEIFTKAQGICKNDQLIKTENYNLDTIKMLKAFYRFKVKRSELSDQINLLQNLVGNPKVIVLIQEEYRLKKKRIEGFSSRNSLTAKLLREHLLSKGYSIIDSAKINKAYLKNQQQIAQQPQNIKNPLKDAAMQAGADVLIIGKVQAAKQDLSALQGTGLKSFRATGSISIMSLWGSGAVIGEYTDSKPGAQVTEYAAARTAIESFARGDNKKKRRKIGGLLAYVDKSLKRKWASLTRNNKIQVTIRSLSLGASGVFRDNLIEATAVKNIDEVQSSAKNIIWEITYPGRSFALANTLSFYGNNPRMFSVLKRKGCQGTHIKVEAVKRGSIDLSFSAKCE